MQTWRSIWSLPDSVAIQTSNDFGTLFREAEQLCGAWTGVYSPAKLFRRKGLPLDRAIIDSYDAFAASTLNALVGYYRLAFVALRSVVENMSVALELELSHERELSQAWNKGTEEIAFGWAADRLHKHQAVQNLQGVIERRLGNNLFRQGAAGRREGYVRLLFRDLSKYAHSRVGYSDGDLWKSNGPILEPGVLLRWMCAFFATYALAVLLVRIGRPKVRTIDDENYPSLRALFLAAVGVLPPRATLRSALRAIPAGIW
jgi:hypothetical protein